MPKYILAGIASMLLLLSAVLAGATSSSARAADETNVVVMGPWKGAEQRAFRSVLDNFQQRNPAVTVTYIAPKDGSVGEALGSASASTTADVAIMSLPTDMSAMQTMAAAGTIKPIEFAVPAVRQNYAFAWKSLGSVNGKLYGVFFKAANDSAFWFNSEQFRNQGLSIPSTWSNLQSFLGRAGSGIRAPLALSSKSAFVLPNLFENVYLMQQGNKRYDALTAGSVKWTDPSVRDAMAAMRNTLVNPYRVLGGVQSGLDKTYATAVQDVFGSPQRASLVPGGSATYPVLYSAKAVRPINEFGVVPFPRINPTGPPRVIGTADAAVMLSDSPAARALISFLATPEAGTIWAKLGGSFLSPNRKVDTKAYPVAAMRTLATSLTRADVFRLSISELTSSDFRSALNKALVAYVRAPSSASQILTQLEAAAPKA